MQYLLAIAQYDSELIMQFPRSFNILDNAVHTIYDPINKKINLLVATKYIIIYSTYIINIIQCYL